MTLRNRTAERRGRQIACVWRTWQGYNLRILSRSWLTSMFSGLLQKDLLKRKWSLAKSYFKQNYCHACHTRFAVFFPLPSCCVSSLAKRRPLFTITVPTVKMESMKSAFGFLHWNPPRGRISRRWNPFSDFAFDCKIQNPDFKSKSWFSNRTQPLMYFTSAQYGHCIL